MAAMNVSSFAFQAMILAREMAALSLSVIQLYVILQRFCTVLQVCVWSQTFKDSTFKHSTTYKYASEAKLKIQLLATQL